MVYHDQTHGVRTWVVGCAFENLLDVEISSKNALILHEKNHPPFHLAYPKYPYIVVQCPSKNGVFEM
jgi:hypothetical protein